MPLSRILATFVAAFILTAWSVLAQEKVAPNSQSIKAEVHGTLEFGSGRGNFISVKSSEFPGRESRVWLWIGEDKVLVRKLEGLAGHEVIARGNLDQMPENVQTSVPALCMFLRLFDIELAATK